MLYMLLTRYTDAAVADLLGDPERVVERDKHAVAFYEALGGKVVDIWFTRDIDYTAVIVVDFPTAEAAHAAVLAGYASGSFTGGKIMQLATTEEFIGALQAARGAAGQLYKSPAE